MLVALRTPKQCNCNQKLLQTQSKKLMQQLSLMSMFQNCVMLWCVSGCFVPKVSPSSGFRPELNAALQLQSRLLERAKVRAKSMQKLLGRSAALQGRSL